MFTIKHIGKINCGPARYVMTRCDVNMRRIRKKWVTSNNHLMHKSLGTLRLWSSIDNALWFSWSFLNLSLSLPCAWLLFIRLLWFINSAASSSPSITLLPPKASNLPSLVVWRYPHDCREDDPCTYREWYAASRALKHYYRLIHKIITIIIIILGLL